MTFYDVTLYGSKVAGSAQGMAGTALYHTLLVREQVARDVELCGEFTWRKKKGIGRRIPREYLDQIVQDGEETWFTLDISEI